MVITNGDDVRNINYIMEGNEIGTLFQSQKKLDFNIMDYITSKQYQK